ncbi:MAG: exodeoxyribonuclease V subunit gamma [Pseudomonadales bacterium]|nr:exodeoxyribonuclease V subunit gamma [Pseudomonadales bacterium]
MLDRPMALYIISSNRVESLQAHMAELLLTAPLPDAFQSEQVVVPGMAMARWLNLELVKSLGIASNINYALPAAWIWQLAADVFAVDEGQQAGAEQIEDPLGRELAAWKIFSLLPDLLQDPEFVSLRAYLKDDESTGIKRWQLAVRIADVFDRYQFYRPDWIRAWSIIPSTRQTGNADEQQAWQRILWQSLIKDLSKPDRVSMIDQLLARMHNNKPPEALPARLCCFALSTLPPLYVQVLQALAGHSDVYLFQHSPTDQYWADIKSKKQLSRLRLQNADSADYYDSGNELLASWGRQGQAFQDLLISAESVDSAQWEDYQEPGTASLLNRLQQGIFKLQNGEIRESVAVDASIKVAVCHSAMRECQVLHDELLHTLQNDAELQPEDILVMIPQISDYAPYIEAVFSYDENGSRPFLPWNLSDTTVAEEHPLVDIFFQLLALPESRFGYSEVMNYLTVPEIMEKFGLDRNGCDAVAVLLQETRVHWGLDGEHKVELTLPAVDQNTWRQAEDRLLASYAMDSEFADTADFTWQELALLPVFEGALGEAAGCFFNLLSKLKRWRELLQGEKSGRTWQLLINTLLDDFFMETGEDDSKLQQIRDVVDRSSQQMGELSISRELLITCLRSSLGSQPGHSRFFSGGITFCGMRPMRSLPFKLICILGLQDMAFPRREQAIEFDLMANYWRPGDPRKGDEDRYLFLETLLCARQRIYFSYCGRSLKDNTPCQPSILLRELLDFIDAAYLPLNGGDGLMSEALTQVHSMQPFNPRNYQGGSDTNSYDDYWCQVARVLQRAEPVQAGYLDNLPLLPDSVDSEERGKNIELGSLQRFLKDPIAGFFNDSLGIYLSQTEQNADEEPFDLDNLQLWSIKQRMLSDLMMGKETALKSLRAEAGLPHGFQGDRVFHAAREAVDKLRDRLVEYQQCTQTPLAIELEMKHGYVLSAQSRLYSGRGLLHASPSKFKGKAVLAIWLEHLVLCAAEKLPAEECSLLIATDRVFRFPVLPSTDAMTILEDYLALYRLAWQRPLCFFPASSFSWMWHYHLSTDEEKANKEALKVWKGNEYYGPAGEEAEPYVQLALRGQKGNPLHREEFRELAKRFFARALANGESK